MKKLFIDGERIKSQIIENIQNFHVKLNGSPRREITFKTEYGDLHEFKFFGERLANILKENTTLDIIVVKDKKAIPAPEYFHELSDSESIQNRKIEIEDKQNEAFEKWVQGAETFKKNEDYVAAASFYESALIYKNDKLIALHLLDVYKKLKDTEKEKQLRETIKNWQ